MNLIASLPELIKNTLYLEQKLNSENLEEKIKAIALIKNGACFLRYTVENRTLFAPSRFIGYQDNTISLHINNRPHGSITNTRIIKILGQSPKKSLSIDIEYNTFCKLYNIVPNKTGSFGAERKFWDLESLETNIYGNIELPEGNKKYVSHVRRERSPRIRQIAIERFLAAHKNLYCEACSFDFEKKYGTVGKNFIECHHTIPLCKMKDGHKTKPEDIVLLCSNCHRIIHKSDDWLTLEELKDLINKHNIKH